MAVEAALVGLSGIRFTWHLSPCTQPPGELARRRVVVVLSRDQRPLKRDAAAALLDVVVAGVDQLTRGCSATGRFVQHASFSMQPSALARTYGGGGRPAPGGSAPPRLPTVVERARADIYRGGGTPGTRCACAARLPTAAERARGTPGTRCAGVSTRLASPSPGTRCALRAGPAAGSTFPETKRLKTATVYPTKSRLCVDPLSWTLTVCVSLSLSLHS